jgi:hypothetical protein
MNNITSVEFTCEANVTVEGNRLTDSQKGFNENHAKFQTHRDSIRMTTITKSLNDGHWQCIAFGSTRLIVRDYLNASTSETILSSLLS